MNGECVSNGQMTFFLFGNADKLILDAFGRTLNVVKPNLLGILSSKSIPRRVALRAEHVTCLYHPRVK